MKKFETEKEKEKKCEKEIMKVKIGKLIKLKK